MDRNLSLLIALNEILRRASFSDNLQEGFDTHFDKEKTWIPLWRIRDSIREQTGNRDFDKARFQQTEALINDLDPILVQGRNQHGEKQARLKRSVYSVQYVLWLLSQKTSIWTIPFEKKDGSGPLTLTYGCLEYVEARALDSEVFDFGKRILSEPDEMRDGDNLTVAVGRLWKYKDESGRYSVDEETISKEQDVRERIEKRLSLQLDKVLSETNRIFGDRESSWAKDWRKAEIRGITIGYLGWAQEALENYLTFIRAREIKSFRQTLEPGVIFSMFWYCKPRLKEVWKKYLKELSDKGIRTLPLKSQPDRL